MISRKKTAEREKIKLEIAKLVSENDEFTKKIAHYRSIVNHAIMDGLDGYYTYFDISENGNQFVVLGTKNDIKSWCKRQGFVFEDIVARKFDVNKTTDLTTIEIMSIKLLEWIDEEICSVYYHSNPEGYHNTNKDRKKVLTKILEERLDDTIIMYINRRIFWASPCKLSNNSFLKNKEWMIYWCKVPMSDVAEEGAEADYEEGANIALSHPDDKAMTMKAISKLKSAIEYYHVCGMTRRAALGSALVAGLSAKIRNRQDMISHAKYAVDNLDKALDGELINACKGLLFYRDSTDIATLPQTKFATSLTDWITKKQETSKPVSPPEESTRVQIYRVHPAFINDVHIAGYLGSFEESKISEDYISSLFGGGIYQLRHMITDKHGHASIKFANYQSIPGDPKPAVELNWKAGDNTAPNIGPPLNKKHILVTKPPITVSLNAEEAYQNIKPKKRSEATKKILSNIKAKQPKPCAKEIDFVKAAVSGNLFKDEPDEA